MNKNLLILSSWAGKLPDNAPMLLTPRLEKLPEDKCQSLAFISLKDPVVGLILGLFFGCFGVDRFYKGDIVLGILKLILLFVFFIGVLWALIDLYFVWVGIKKDNFNKVNLQLSLLGV